MEWEKERVLRLVELYRERPVLWDCREAGYKDRNDRARALTDIAQALDVDKDEIDRKIKNLMSHFSRECKKENEMKRGRSYKSKWFAYDAMTFLKERPTTRKPEAHLDQDSVVQLAKEKGNRAAGRLFGVSESSVREWSSDEPALETMHPQRRARRGRKDFSVSTSDSSMEPMSNDFLSGISIISAPEPTTKKRFKKRRSQDESPQEVMINDEVRISAEDKFSLWAKVWGSKLRELPNDQVIHAEKLINDVLYEASLGNLSRKCSLNIPTLNGND